MSKDVLLDQTRTSVENHGGTAVKPQNGRPACHAHGNGWLKGGLVMVICCAAPLLIIAAVALSGISLGTLASGFLSVAALLACPVGMYLMMRMMMNRKN